MSALLVENPNQQLRQELSKITKKPIEEQISLIKALQPRYHHSISWLDEPGSPPYNCVEYAFDLINLPDRIRLDVDCVYGQNQAPGTGVAPRIHPLGTAFVNFLIERGVLQKVNCAGSGGVIVYLDKERVQHTGKIQGELVRSKWDCTGHLWKHCIDEVPIGYGDKVRFFKSVARNEVFQYLSGFMGAVRNADTTRQRKRLLASLHQPWP